MKRRNANVYIFIFSNAIFVKDYDKNEGTTVKNEGTIDKREAYTELCFEKSNLYIALMVIISIFLTSKHGYFLHRSWDMSAAGFEPKNLQIGENN